MSPEDARKAIAKIENDKRSRDARKRAENERAHKGDAHR
jgi:hypothetical protein